MGESLPAPDQEAARVLTPSPPATAPAGEGAPTAATVGDDGVDPAWPPVGVVIVGYQSRADLPECLASVLDQDYAGRIEVVFVDNGSSDGSAAYVREAFPAVATVESGGNLGYAGGTNLGLRHAGGDYLISLNPDTTVDRGFVRALVEAGRRHGDRALVTSRVVFHDRPGTINTYGNVVNFAMVATCRGLGEGRERHEREEEVPAISGCAFLIPRRVLEHVGAFDEALHLYLEDTDLSLRAQAAGYRCVAAPGSLVSHKYRLNMGASKFFYLERNRWLVLLNVYRPPTLLVLLPALLAIEAMTWVGAARLGRGHLAAKARSYAALAGSAAVVRRRRRRLDAIRRLPDRAMLGRLQGPLPVGELVPEAAWARGAMEGINRVLTAYLSVARRVVRW